MRISEVYQSVQGEGPRVGVPTTFVRFAGCNLRCPGWPCDTQHAIDPEKYRHEWKTVAPYELLEQIPTWPLNVCLTGGEPTLQPDEELTWLVDELNARNQHVEMFSNGFLPYSDTVTDYVSVVMDWKLPGCGETFTEKMLDDRLRNLCENMGALDSVKFTISNPGDFDTAVKAWNNLLVPLAVARRPMVFAGVVWDKLENKDLADWILTCQLPWRLNVQIHNYIWERSDRGI